MVYVLRRGQIALKLKVDNNDGGNSDSNKSNNTSNTPKHQTAGTKPTAMPVVGKMTAVQQ